MAIIQCPNCGGSVSDKAQQCPHCHAQLQKQGSGQAQQMGTPRPVVKEESLPASATVAAKPELKAQPTAQKVTTAKEPEVQHYLFESVHSLSRYTFRQMSKKTSVDLTQNINL